MTPQIKDRRSESRPIPTVMMQAVAGLEKWKLNVMFVVGISGMGAIVYWFVSSDHEHSTAELIAAGVGFAGCAFFAFPLGVTRFADKFWPAKWRTERRSK